MAVTLTAFLPTLGSWVVMYNRAVNPPATAVAGSARVPAAAIRIRRRRAVRRRALRASTIWVIERTDMQTILGMPAIRSHRPAPHSLMRGTTEPAPDERTPIGRPPARREHQRPRASHPGELDRAGSKVTIGPAT